MPLLDARTRLHDKMVHKASVSPRRRSHHERWQTVSKGKIALVTGASRGIGLAIARSLAGMGAKVGVCARDAKKLETAAAGLKSGRIASSRFART